MLYSPIIVRRFGLESIYSNPYLRCVEFLIGMLLSSLTPEANDIVRRYVYSKTAIMIEIFVIVMATSAVSKAGIGNGNYMLYSWIVLPMFSLMLPALAMVQWERVCHLQVIPYLSEISYAFFLTQLFLWPVMKFLIEILNINSNLVKILFSFAICSIFAIMIHEIIERPIKKLWIECRLYNRNENI